MLNENTAGGAQSARDAHPCRFCTSHRKRTRTGRGRGGSRGERDKIAETKGSLESCAARLVALDTFGFRTRCCRFAALWCACSQWWGRGIGRKRGRYSRRSSGVGGINAYRGSSGSREREFAAISCGRTLLNGLVHVPELSLVVTDSRNSQFVTHSGPRSDADMHSPTRKHTSTHTPTHANTQVPCLRHEGILVLMLKSVITPDVPSSNDIATTAASSGNVRCSVEQVDAAWRQIQRKGWLAGEICPSV